MDTEPVYREVQRFRQWWLWTLLSGAALLLFLAGPISWIGLLILGAVAVFLYSLRLETEVKANGIYFRMWPLHQSFRRIEWADIKHYEAKTYNPIREFGGWGIRWTPGKVAYNVSGNQGIWIQRASERSILIGSQRVEEFADALDEVYDR